MLSEKLIRDFLTLWTTIDPVSTLLVFVSLTAGMSRKERNHIATWAIIYSGGVLTAVIIIGQLLLGALGISMIAFQIAGGVVFLVYAMQLIFGQGPVFSQMEAESGKSIAVFPLALPATATPAAIMAVLVLTDNHLYPIGTQLATTGAMLVVLAVAYILMRQADSVLKAIGRPGAELIVRIMGILLAALAVQLVFDALGVEGLLP